MKNIMIYVSSSNNINCLNAFSTRSQQIDTYLYKLLILLDLVHTADLVDQTP
jgi:hypothetical protein